LAIFQPRGPAGLAEGAGLTSSIDHFTRCKQHWSRSTSCFSFFNTTWKLG